MEFQEYPKWIYPAGVCEFYEPGQEPYLAESVEDLIVKSSARKPKSSK